jgi:hypothetical protein
MEFQCSKSLSRKVSKILDESVFKLITNPLYLNALKWQDRRNVLIDIAGHISDADLGNENTKTDFALQMINHFLIIKTNPCFYQKKGRS